MARKIMLALIKVVILKQTKMRMEMQKHPIMSGAPPETEKITIWNSPSGKMNNFCLTRSMYTDSILKIISETMSRPNKTNFLHMKIWDYLIFDAFYFFFIGSTFDP